MKMFKSVSPQEIVDFTKNLSVMLKSGIPLNESLASLSSQTKSKTFHEVVMRLQREIEQGTSLTESILKEKNIFGAVTMSLVRAGEASGRLPESLSFLSTWLERSNDLSKEIAGAMFYPKIVLTATFLLGGGLTVLVLPRLTPLFSQLHVALPLSTRILMGISHFVEHYWHISLVGIIAFIVLFMFLRKIYRVKRVLNLTALYIPFFKYLTRDYQLALTAQLMTTLLRSGVTLRDSILIVTEAIPNIIFSDSLKVIQKKVESGSMFSEGLKIYPDLYPQNMVAIIAVGERSGTIDQSFEYVTEYYLKEISNRTKKMPTIVEPVLLIIIGCVVGFIAAAIISPIYELTSGLSR